MRNKHSLFTDDELLLCLQKGDEQAFSEIYDRYWEKLLSVAFFHSRDEQASEDIVHDVMLSLWTRRSEIKIESLNAYLAMAVRFSIFKAIGRERRRRELLARQDITVEFADTEEKLEAKFLKESLEETLERLPEKTRLVFKYSRGEGLSVSEIAHKVDLSPKAVEYHITKALRVLRNKLKKIKSFFI